MESLRDIADGYFHAFYNKAWERPHFDPGRLSMAEAYEVQDLVTKRRVDSGEKPAGYKVGCTSPAIRSQFGLSEPICGRLFHPHVWNEGVCLDWSAFANCAIEPEMVLFVGRELRGDNLTDDALLEAIEFVGVGVEIHNFKFWQGRPSHQELICSGGIHAGLVVGPDRVSPRVLSFSKEVFRVYKGASLTAEASAHEIMGGPLLSLRWLVGFLSKRGRALERGSLVIPGSPTELVVINEDTELSVEIERMGKVSVSFRRARSSGESS